MNKRAIYYDTETTGIKPDKDRIIEIAAYDPAQDRVFEELINPEVPIPLEVSAIHNITDEMVAEAPNFSEIGKRFAEFCEGDVVLIAHNNDNFDILFLHAEFKRANLPPPSWTCIDTLKWARKYRPDLPKHTLQFLRQSFGIPANNAHRALDDVVVLHKVFSFMLDDLTVEQALLLLDSPRKIRTMPFGKYQGKPLADVSIDYLKWLCKSGAFEKPENYELLKSFEEIHGKLVDSKQAQNSLLLSSK